MEKSLTVYEVNFSRYVLGRWLKVSEKGISTGIWTGISQGDMDRNHHKKNLDIYFLHMRCFGIHVASFNNMFHLTKPILTCVKLNVCVWYAVHPESPTGFDRCCTRESIFHIKNLDSNISYNAIFNVEENWSCFIFSHAIYQLELPMVYQTKHGLILHLLLVYFFFGLCLETTCYINIHDFEQPHFCFNRFLSVRKLQRVRETLWMLPAHHTVRDTLRAAYITHTLWEWETPWELPALHLESERNPESCLYTSNTLRVRDTLRAAYITHTLWEWEKPWELLIHIKHLESERNLESCLHHTLWEWETLWELPASHLVRVRDTLRAAYITTCESVRKTLRQLPSETLCESFTWRDFLWALV